MSADPAPLIVDEATLLSFAETISDHEDRIHALETGQRGAAAGSETDGDDEAALNEYVRHLCDDFLWSETLGTAWRDVPAVVAELDALRRARAFAYSDEAGAFERVYYHDALERVRERVTTHRQRHRKRSAAG